MGPGSTGLDEEKPMRLRLFPSLVALFVGLPLLDVLLLVGLGQYLTFWPTVGLVIVSGFVGAALAKSQGRSVWFSIQRDLAEGRVPSQGLLDGVIILVAGGMLAAPGFVTDLLGLLLLIPAVRKPIKALLRRRIEAMIRGGIASGRVQIWNETPSAQPEPPAGAPRSDPEPLNPLP